MYYKLPYRTLAGQVSQHFGDLPRIDTRVLGYPDSAQDVFGVEVGVELLHFPRPHQVALHPRGPVAAGPTLQRDEAIPRRCNVHAPAIFNAQVKTLVLPMLPKIKIKKVKF